MKEERIQMQVNELYKIRQKKTQPTDADTVHHLEPTYKNIHDLDL